MKYFSLSASMLLLAIAFQTVHAQQRTIGLAVHTLQTDFPNQIKESVEKAAKTAGVKVVTVDARGDSATQVSQIQDLITRKIDALIYIPAGAEAATISVRAARAAGIPVVTLDRNPEGAPGDTFIATDSFNATRELGQYVCQISGGKGNLAILQGQLGTTPEIDRDNGFKAAMSACPGIREVARQASNMWLQEEGFAIAQDMLQRNRAINIIFGRSDGLAMGAAQAAKIAGLKVLVVGFDGDRAGLEAIKAGTFQATMTQQTQKMGRVALQSALDLIDGKQLPAVQLQPATLTTKDNVDGFIANHP